MEIEKKLEAIRKELGQTIIIRLGLPAKGGYDILGIECCGSARENEDQKKPAEKTQGNGREIYLG